MKGDIDRHLHDYHSLGTSESWLGVDLRKFGFRLHRFSFLHLTPEGADLNVNIAYGYGDIYGQIGMQLERIFPFFKFSKYINIRELNYKFLILDPDCAFSNTDEVTDQRWKVPTKYNIPENSYYCYNLQLINLYNHTSLTFACNVCNFNKYSYMNPNPLRLGEKNKDTCSVRNTHWYMFYHQINCKMPMHNLNNVGRLGGFDAVSPWKYFIKKLFLKIDFSFANDEKSDQYYWRYHFDKEYDMDDYGYHHEFFESVDHVDYGALEGNYGTDHFDRSQVNHLVSSKQFEYNGRTGSMGQYPVHTRLEFAVFSQHCYSRHQGLEIISFAGAGWTNTHDFPDGSGSYWGFNLTTEVLDYYVEYNSSIFNSYTPSGGWGRPYRSCPDYSDFIKLDRKPDYILTSENEFYWFYRSSVTFNFFNTKLLDEVIMNKVNEGIDQTLFLDHDYTLTKKAGCYRFTLKFNSQAYIEPYYGYRNCVHSGSDCPGLDTITFNIRIIPDYDFSQGLNAVTLNVTARNNNYTPYYWDEELINLDPVWVVDIYLDKKTIKQFYKLLFKGPSIRKSYLSIFDQKKINFKNLRSLHNLNLEESINYFQDNHLYQFLNDQITHFDDAQHSHWKAFRKIIKPYFIKNNLCHLHFVLRQDSRTKYWNIINSGKVNIDHFYDKIVQPDQWK